MLDERIRHDQRPEQQSLDNRLSEPIKYATCYIVAYYVYAMLSRILPIHASNIAKLTFVDGGVVCLY